MAIELHQIKMNDPRYQEERELRNEVLLRPIGVNDYGWEMWDEESFHIVAVEDGRVIGCVILRPLDGNSGTAQLLQMAVKPERQGKGVGVSLIEKLLEVAKSQGISRVVCHARDTAIGFYNKVGFKVFGEPFDEAGIGHHHMEKVVNASSSTYP